MRWQGGDLAEDGVEVQSSLPTGKNIDINGDREMMMMVRKGLESAPPWSPIPSPYLRAVAGIDPQRIAMARWRGKFPPPLPSRWFRGHTTWTLAGDILRWAGDSHNFRQQLEKYVNAKQLAIFHDLDPVTTVEELESLGLVSHPVSPRWSSVGLRSWLDEIKRRARLA